MRAQLSLLVALIAFVIAPIVHAQTPAAAAADAGGAGVVVTLSDPGAEPRSPLRYRLAEIGPQTMIMSMRMTMTIDAGFGSINQAMPTIQTTMRISEVELLPSSNARITFALDEMEALPSDDVDPMVMQAVRMGLSAVGNMAGWIEIDARGAYIDGDFDTTGVDPTIAELLSSMEDSMNQMTIPFPVEPVGVGARWTAVTEHDSGGIAISQTAGYELRSRTDDMAELGVTVTQSAGVQTITQPGIPSVELISYSASGHGTTTVRFDDAVPDADISIEVSTSTAMDMGAEMGGRVETSVQMHMETTIRPGEVGPAQ